MKFRPFVRKCSCDTMKHLARSVSMTRDALMCLVLWELYQRMVHFLI